MNGFMTETIVEILPLLKENSRKADNDNSFVTDNLLLLKKRGCMNFLIPSEFGGYGGSLNELIEISKILGSACLSTGMIWAMHNQQLACIINHASKDFKNTFFKKIVEGNYYLGSAITESGKSESILAALAPLYYPNDGVIEIKRNAPIVTGGINCDAYLISMRKDQSSPFTDVKFIYVEKDQVEIKQESREIHMMGMRGTNSVSLSFNGCIPSSQIINGTFAFDEIAYSTMIPIGHIAWVACWLGAATGVFKEMIKVFRKPVNKSRFNIDSDLFLEKIARIRMHFDAVSALLKVVSSEYSKLFESDRQKLQTPGFLIKINNLKIYSSETLFNAMNDLMEVAGVRYGYMQSEVSALERVFRDLRSASLMINNDKLLVSNGKLCLFEKTF